MTKTCPDCDATVHSSLAATPADEEARDNLRLIDYIANKIELPETDELSQENFDAWMFATNFYGEKAVLIYRAAALVLAASDIDMQGRTCGSVRAGHILTKISDRLRNDGVALRKKADVLPASPPEQPAADPAHTSLLRLADNIGAHGDSITYPSRQAAREVRNVIRELTAALRTGEII